VSGGLQSFLLPFLGAAALPPVASSAAGFFSPSFSGFSDFSFAPSAP